MQHEKRIAVSRNLPVGILSNTEILVRAYRVQCLNSLPSADNAELLAKIISQNIVTASSVPQQQPPQHQLQQRSIQPEGSICINSSLIPCIDDSQFHAKSFSQHVVATSPLLQQKLLPPQPRPQQSRSIRTQHATRMPTKVVGSITTTRVVPAPLDVVCARGRDAWNHPGNKNLRRIIEQRRQKYSLASSKMERSDIVSRIVGDMRSKGISFLKQDVKSRLWKDIGDALARNKVGHLLRNSLSSQFRSSAEAKISRRRNGSGKLHQSLSKTLHSNPEVSYIINKLSVDMSDQHGLLDAEVMQIFNQANVQLLAAFKKDTTLVVQFHLTASSSSSASMMVSDNLSDEGCILPTDNLSDRVIE